MECNVRPQKTQGSKMDPEHHVQKNELRVGSPVTDSNSMTTVSTKSLTVNAVPANDSHSTLF